MGTSGAVVITGCSSGIGRATALRFVRAGRPVWATARQPHALAELAKAGCSTAVLDVTDGPALEALVGAVEAAHGAVGVLINNAGYGLQGPLEETPLERVRHQFEVNVFAPMRLIQLVLPGMRRHGGGRIVNVSSMGGRLTFPGGSAYHGSKYALEAVSDVLRWEVAPFGIGVTVVEPGPTLSRYGDAALASLHDMPVEGPYGALTASIDAALNSTFAGAGLPGASTPDDVAAAIEASIEEEPAPTRLVVGAMAEWLLELRRRSTDQQWDEVMGTMYVRPGGSLTGDAAPPQ